MTTSFEKSAIDRAVLILLLASTAWSSCPNKCEPAYEPVCGSDNRTYSNMCTLLRLNCKNNSNTVKVKHFGKCKDEHIEPSDENCLRIGRRKYLKCEIPL